MSIGLGILFWVIVIVAAIAWFTRASYPHFFGWAMIACVIILGIAEFGGLHVAGK